MMYNTHIGVRAFTFVELIVSITIVALLSTIGFVVYKSYLASSYDSNRILQISDIQNGLDTLRIQAKLPLPENAVELRASGNSFALQGEFGKNAIETIGYQGGQGDIEYGIPLVYMTNTQGTKFQLMTFVRDSDMLTVFPQTYAEEIEYGSFFPLVRGDELGILLETATNTPLQKTSLPVDHRYDIVTGTGELTAYFSQNESYSSLTQNISVMLPRGSCKRLLDLGTADSSGVYTLHLEDGTKQQAYCDMHTEGGGWTLVARSHEGQSFSKTGDFGWTSRYGSPTDMSDMYSFGSGSLLLGFGEIMLGSFFPNSNTVDKAVIVDVDPGYIQDETLHSTHSFSSNKRLYSARDEWVDKPTRMMNMWGNIGQRYGWNPDKERGTFSTGASAQARITRSFFFSNYRGPSGDFNREYGLSKHGLKYFHTTGVAGELKNKQGILYVR